MAREWPEDLRWVLQAYLDTQNEWDPHNTHPWRLFDSPRFFFLRDRNLELATAGFRGWNEKFVPYLNKTVGT